MTDFTLTIDEDLLRRARIRALEDGTSVDAVVREFLAAYAGQSESVTAVAHFVAVASQSEAGGDGTSRAWNRDDIYEGI